MEPMTDVEIRHLLGQSRLGHLALANGGRAYVIPISFGFDGQGFYFHSQPGLKDEYVLATEEACFVVDRVVSEDEWASVIATGALTEVVDDPERLRAMNALIHLPDPPAWGSTARGQPERKPARRVYKLTPTRITGRRSNPPGAVRSDREIGIHGM